MTALSQVGGSILAVASPMIRIPEVPIFRAAIYFNGTRDIGGRKVFTISPMFIAHFQRAVEVETTPHVLKHWEIDTARIEDPELLEALKQEQDGGVSQLVDVYAAMVSLPHKENQFNLALVRSSLTGELMIVVWVLSQGEWMISASRAGDSGRAWYRGTRVFGGRSPTTH